MTTAIGPEPAIHIEALVKRYGASNVLAVDHIDLEVRRGEIFGLLGPNGAGKTTTIGICTTRVIPAMPVSVNVASWPMLVIVILLASLISGAFGLVLGTLFQPQQVPLIFSIIVIPVTFLGCVYYPWQSLAPLPILRYAVLLNPEDALSRCSTEHAPWFVIPADHKWFRNLAVARIVVEQLETLDMKYPEPKVDLRHIHREYHAAKEA